MREKSLKKHHSQGATLHTFGKAAPLPRLVHLATSSTSPPHHHIASMTIRLGLTPLL
jgi:hypothetical protein